MKPQSDFKGILTQQLVSFLHQATVRSRTLCSRIADAYDREPGLRNAVVQEAHRPLPSPDGRRGNFQFSVTIPHFNRGRLMHRPLRNLLHHPAVAEIVIVDDGSSQQEFEYLRETLSELGNPARVRLIRREENRGALETKREGVEKASCPWVLVLDSDNTAFCSFLNALSRLREPDPNVFYAAAWAFPFFPFHPLIGRALDFDDACRLTREGTLRRVFIINDGNYLVSRDAYLQNVNAIGKLASDVADVMVVNYKCLSAGMNLKILPGTAYYHRVHPSSFWMQTQDESKKRVLQIFSRLDRELRWDSDFLNQLNFQSS